MSSSHRPQRKRFFARADDENEIRLEALFRAMNSSLSFISFLSWFKTSPMNPVVHAA